MNTAPYYLYSMKVIKPAFARSARLNTPTPNTPAHARYAATNLCCAQVLMRLIRG
jgi:hypothetical protein